MSMSVHGRSRLPSAARPWAVAVRSSTSWAGSAPAGAAHTANPTFGSMVVKGWAPVLAATAPGCQPARADPVVPRAAQRGLPALGSSALRLHCAQQLGALRLRHHRLRLLAQPLDEGRQGQSRHPAARHPATWPNARRATATAPPSVCDRLVRRVDRTPYAHSAGGIVLQSLGGRLACGGQDGRTALRREVVRQHPMGQLQLHPTPTGVRGQQPEFEPDLRRRLEKVWSGRVSQPDREGYRRGGRRRRGAGGGAGCLTGRLIRRRLQLLAARAARIERQVSAEDCLGRLHLVTPGGQPRRAVAERLGRSRVRAERQGSRKRCGTAGTAGEVQRGDAGRRGWAVGWGQGRAGPAGGPVRTACLLVRLREHLHLLLWRAILRSRGRKPVS
eukprot:scaffold14053_cov102-Isochrysis_galbana.AAC.4